METTLLVGNGLNRCLENSISWSELLNEIAKTYGVNYNGEISMPLEFESIMNQIHRNQENPSTKVYTEVKGMIAKKVKSIVLPADAIHRELQSIHVGAIMTTNYDYLLEHIYNPDYKYEGLLRRTYLFDHTSIQNSVPFYHVHGCADNPKSICLGYEHYMGVVENLRSALNTKENSQPTDMLICKVLRGEKKQTCTWYERFYTDDISIVGLGLSESETDLWWLLTHRAYLYYSDYYGIRNNLGNTITYYDIVSPNGKDYADKIHYMLRNLHVAVRSFELGKDCGDYKEGYRMIFEEMKHPRNDSAQSIPLQNQHLEKVS